MENGMRNFVFARSIVAACRSENNKQPRMREEMTPRCPMERFAIKIFRPFMMSFGENDDAPHRTCFTVDERRNCPSLFLVLQEYRVLSRSENFSHSSRQNDAISSFAMVLRT